MQSLRFFEFGEPREVLELATRELSPPSVGEVRVRMLAAPVNPSDMMFIRGNYTTTTTLPGYPGFEGVGVVEQSGGGLRGRLLNGRRVVVMNRGGGNWAEEVVVSDQSVIPVSSALSDEQAATFFVNPATAWILTRQILKVPTDGWLVQSAAASSLGQMIVRLGDHCGFRTLNIVRREEQAGTLKAAGARHVVVWDPEQQTAQELDERVRAVIGADGASAIIDPVGGPTTAALAECLALRGRLIVFGTLSDMPMTLSSRTLMSSFSGIEGFWLGHYMAGLSLISKLSLVRKIGGLITSGILSTETAAAYPLGAFEEAVNAAETPGRQGKILFTMSSSGG